ncbi:hypothetical protein PR202_ga29431 [Eleusine coracana subsp. coracana]|uniref:Uncharacterized protein n=1 Tax=Eleusine coracana subsp. coracana TaxID=191504 RepID=A0AAV5DL74_ELECO|nr:hypothetical protein PR202_ga29431 [Eleusine coracana subsp. coracana]
MGTAALPIETPFALPGALPSWPASDGGFATGVIDLGGLEVRQVTTFAKVWSTTHGGEDGQGATFFEPAPVPAGFSVLGHYAQPNNRPLFGRVLVARDASSGTTTGGASPFLAPPLDFTLVWSSPDDAASFWLPIAPEGYKAVGVLVTATKEKPALDEVRCVRADFTDACEAEEAVWSSGDKDGGFSAVTLRPAVRGIDARGVHAGTFLAQSNNGLAASTSVVACLKNTSSASYTSSAMPDLAQVNALLAAYAPQVYLHPDESYFPSSVPWFFDTGALLYDKGNPTNPTPVARDGSNLPRGGGNDGAYWLDLPADKEQRERVGPLTVALGRIGEHVGDWEHVTLRVSNFDGGLVRAYFSQHSAGEWVDASRLEYMDGGNNSNRPVAYASRHGHAFYPRAGTVLQGDARLGVGIRNDCARGSVMDAAAGRCEVVSAEYLGSGVVVEPPWLGFDREWGPREEYDLGREINRVARFLPRSARERLAKLVNKLLVGEGPTGPKMHGNWRNDEKES